MPPHFVPPYPKKKKTEEKKAREKHLQELEDKLRVAYKPLSIAEVCSQLEDDIPHRKLLRERLVEELRCSASLFAKEEEKRFRIKVNNYPGEISDERLVDYAREYLLQKSTNSCA